MTQIKPHRITFTGVDEWTDPAWVEDLSGLYPIEWGILFGGRLGKMRYPTMNTVEHITNALKHNPDVRFSAHLCGSVLNGQIRDHVLPDIPFSAFNRIQVNAIQYNFDDLLWLHQATGVPIIAQYRTRGLNEFPQVKPPAGIQYLHDESGGRGIVPQKRPPQGDYEYVGYAGGINSRNIAEVVSSLEATHYWIDMESGVRNGDDILDFDMIAENCEAVFGP